VLRKPYFIIQSLLKKIKYNVFKSSVK